MFETQQFINDALTALKETQAQAAIQELVERTVSNPSQIIQQLGEPKRAGIETLYRADDLTILNLYWGPGMELKPHDHRIWAVIGIYGGREQNTFYRRSEAGLVQHGSKELHTKDTVPLGESVIHSVKNPLDKITAAIHVYGGDFFDTERSEWDPVTLEEQPYSVEDTLRVFEESNRQLGEVLSRVQ